MEMEFTQKDEQGMEQKKGRIQNTKRENTKYTRIFRITMSKGENSLKGFSRRYFLQEWMR